MTLRIAPMRDEDCADVTVFLDSAVPSSWRTTAPADIDQCRRVLHSAAAITILARDGDTLVGLAAGWIFPNLVVQGESVMLDELLVGAPYRGQGVGTALVRAFTQTARQQAKAPITIWATTDYPDEPAATAFKRTGGTEGGLLRQFDWPQEAYK